jgi:copper chaperone
MDTTVLKVNGMTCEGCVRSVKRVVQARTGTEPEVSLEQGEVRLPAGVDAKAAAEAIVGAGFEVAAG